MYFRGENLPIRAREVLRHSDGRRTATCVTDKKRVLKIHAAGSGKVVVVKQLSPHSCTWFAIDVLLCGSVYAHWQVELREY